MTDDELDRILRAARPKTPADDGWADSEEADQALNAIVATGGKPVGNPTIRTLKRIRPFGLGIGLTAAAAAVVAVGLALPGPAPHRSATGAPPPSDSVPAPLGATPPQMTLAAYDSCRGMLDGLRKHTAANITAYGLPGANLYSLGGSVLDRAGAKVPAPAANAQDSASPDHSGTNDQETGADEPDIVKNDGRRVVTVSAGVLRVVDAASHKVTGSLDLQIYAGADSAQLLMSGNRVLVLLGASGYAKVAVDGPRPAGGYVLNATDSTFLLVDIAGAPTVVSTLHADGAYVDARLIDGTARVVVDNTPRLTFPVLPDSASDKQRLAANRRAVQRAPLSAWLPTYQTSGPGGATSTHTVPCDRVSHPKRYTGESMVTVYSVEPSTTLDDPHPISIAADGATVYASPANLYVASSDGRATQLHRFYVGAPGTPRYVGSGRVPGWLLNSYSMSEYDGSLRVVTTSARQVTALYVLDADTLRTRGSVGGLGAGENLHAVRFLGPLAYVVTFESVDPLFVLDLHDPAHPRRAGELKVPGYSDYLHPTDAGRLLGVGETVDGSQRVSGLQVSLFDISAADHPKRLDVITRKHTPSETPIDPHAFLYWPSTRTAVIPIDSWEGTESGAALVVHVGPDALRTVGTVRNPAVASVDNYQTGIERTLVIGDDLWTMSSSGLQVSGLESLSRRAWIPFS